MLTSKLGNTFSKFGKETEKHIDNALTWLQLGDNLTNVCPVSYLLLNIHIYIASNVNHYKVDHDSVFSATTIPPFLPIPKSLALEGYLFLIIVQNSFCVNVFEPVWIMQSFLKYYNKLFFWQKSKQYVNEINQ